ncbi:hypothetical protein ACJX0J_005954, partial [Zea mays]
MIISWIVIQIWNNNDYWHRLSIVKEKNLTLIIVKHYKGPMIMLTIIIILLVYIQIEKRKKRQSIPYIHTEPFHLEHLSHIENFLFQIDQNKVDITSKINYHPNIFGNIAIEKDLQLHVTFGLFSASLFLREIYVRYLHAYV